jgi:hypothetical protein
MKRINQREAVYAINRTEEFRANSLSGQNYYYQGTGQLYGESLELFHNGAKKIVYAVFSYVTPIAWKYEDGTWYIVPEKFSVTTSRHQSRVRQALTPMAVAS